MVSMCPQLNLVTYCMKSNTSMKMSLETRKCRRRPSAALAFQFGFAFFFFFSPVEACQ